MSVERVRYFDGQFLRLEDFQDEQAYQIAMRRRHNLSHHTWGIVSGLEPQAVEGQLSVKPGFAVDGFGRELALEKLQPLSPDAFVDFDTDLLEVWIEYARVPSDAAAAGFDRRNGGGEFYRVAETPRVRLAKPVPGSLPRAPDGLAASDLGFDATRAAPEDRRWPVYLGAITFRPEQPDAPYTIDLSNRPYAGLVGEEIASPSGGARVQIGSEKRDDPNRFAVFIPAAATRPRLAIQQDGKLMAVGETTVDGSLTVNGGSLEIGSGGGPPPNPWRIYRIQESDANGKTHTDLRIEMGSGGAGDNQIVFGTWSVKDNKFKPCLTIADDGTVTVSGNLVVKGNLKVNPENISAGQLTTEAQAFVASGALAGVGANLRAARLTRDPGREIPPAIDEAQGAALESEDQANRFAEQVHQQNPAIAAKLAAKLRQLLGG